MTETRKDGRRVQAWFNDRESLDCAQHAIHFCTGHDLTRATEAGVTLDSVLGALRRFQKDFCSGYCRQLSNASDHFEKCNDARAILAHFPDGDESNG